MRILSISAYYPPTQYDWGYTQLCEEAVDGLVSRGHQVTVLTSTYPPIREVSRPYSVHRIVEPSPDWHSSKLVVRQFWIGRRHRESAAVKAFYQLVDEFQPQVVLIWNTLGLPNKLLKAAESLPGVAIAYYTAGYLPETTSQYPAYWNKKAISRPRELVKRPLSWLARCLLRLEGEPTQLKYRNVICVSDYIRTILVSHSLVGPNVVTIHNGIDIAQFPVRPIPVPEEVPRPLSCLYAGRIESHKGVHTIVEALYQLAGELGPNDIHTTIVGDGKAEYVSRLRQRVQDLGLNELITVRPRVARSAMPELLAQFDVLLMPSRFEALSRMAQEAMATGLVVVGTVTGGSSELLIHGETGLAFPPEDAPALAAQLRRLLAEPDLRYRLVQAGRKTVVEHFTMRRMLDELESYLGELVRHHVIA